MKIKDRIKELRRIRAADLLPNPRNWRSHTPEQADAMRAVLAEVGYADAILVRETADGYQICDGHLRATTTPDTEVPCLVLDVTEAEADFILATHDSITGMAETDATKLQSLLDDLAINNEALQEMFSAMMPTDVFDVDSIEMPELPSGDKSGLQQLTFTLSDDQAAKVKQAIQAAKAQGPFVDTKNENSNGNALARVAEIYLGK